MIIEYRSNGNPSHSQPDPTSDMNRVLLLLCTMFLSRFAWTYFYPYHFALPYFETDFVDYCVGVAQWDDSTAHFPPKRSKWAGWLPYFLANDFLATGYGTLTGLLLASSLSMVGIGILLTGWMERVKPLAGWCTLGFLLSCSPWIGMSRFLNFYPEIVFWLVFATVSMWFGLHSEPTQSRHTTLPMLGKGILVGSSIGICAVTDVRGLIWAGWFIILSIGWKLWNRDALKIGLSFWSGWILSVTGFWHVGKMVYGPHSTSLIRQVDVAPLRIALGLDGSPSTLPTEFRWGWEWRGLIDNIQFILSQQTEGLPNGEPSTYWWTWLGLIVISSLAIFRKYPLVLFTLVPAVIAYLQIGHAVEDHVRFYMQSLPFLIVAPGLFISTLLPESKKARITIIGLIIFVLPYLSLMSQHHWTIEREISHKMLSQAHPSDTRLQNRDIIFGTPIHIQTLPVTQIERRITQHWEDVCIEALQQPPPILWFEYP